MQNITATKFIEILEGKENYPSSLYYQYYSFNDKNRISKVWLKNTRITGSVSLQEPLILPWEVKIERCTFINTIELLHVKFLGDLSFIGCTFNDLLLFNFEVNSLNLVHCKCTEGIVISGGFYENTTIKNVNLDIITIYCAIINRLNIDGDKIGRISIAQLNTFIGELSFGSQIKDTQIAIKEAIINSLMLSGTYNDSNLISIENIEINSLDLCLIKNNGHLLFRDISIKQKRHEVSKISIGEFFDELNISEEMIKKEGVYDLRPIDLNDPLYRLEIGFSSKYYANKMDKCFVELKDNISSGLEIADSYLGRCEFKNVLLNQFHVISIIDTELTTLKTFNSTFPTKKIVGNQHSLYEIFNDLYSVAQKKNNRREQTEYYMASKNALLKSYLNKDWYSHIPSIISLSVSKCYSNFGTRWTQSVFLAIPTVSIICFSCMMLFTNYDFELSRKGWNNITDLATYYFRFIDITHKVNFMDDSSTGFIYSKSLPFIIFDLIGRILIAIGIFETILAFRKYVRK